MPADGEGYVPPTDDGGAAIPYGATVPTRDDSGRDEAGAGASPADPGSGPDEAVDDRRDLVEAVEDLVSELLPEHDGCRPG